MTQTLEQLQNRLALSHQKLTESLSSLIDSYVDPREAFIGDDGRMWEPVGAAMGAGDRSGEPYLSLADLDQIRGICCWLSYSNEFAINGHENRISYIIGWGHTYTVTGKTKDVPDVVVERVQAWLDEWLKVNRWHRRQQETLLRYDRDGEVFRRVFRTSDGYLRVRFVEPSLVKPPSANRPEQSWGVETDPDDVETVVQYWVNDSPIQASDVQHLKANVDSGHKRGLPLFWPVRKNLYRATKLLRNMSTATEIQTAIALIRKHEKATKEAARSFLGAKQATTDAQGRSVLDYPPGSIIDSNQQTSYEFPTGGLDPEKTVAALQAELRAVAARLVFPEFMLTSDASNANYSSTMVAEGPAVKKFQRDQQTMIEADMEIIEAAIDHAVATNLLTAEEVAAIVVSAEPPSVKTRDELKEAQVAQIDMMSGVLSPQTRSAQIGLDYHEEQANIEQHAEAGGAVLTADRPLLAPIPGSPQQ